MRGSWKFQNLFNYTKLLANLSISFLFFSGECQSCDLQKLSKTKFGIKSVSFNKIWKFENWLKLSKSWKYLCDFKTDWSEWLSFFKGRWMKLCVPVIFLTLLPQYSIKIFFDSSFVRILSNFLAEFWFTFRDFHFSMYIDCNSMTNSFPLIKVQHLI